MREIWVRFGCFLTGYNYNIIKASSEAAAKTVKKYTAAMVIVCILWFFIGFTFAQRYLQLSVDGSIAGGLIAVIIIVQIERQIILSIGPSRGLYIARGAIAVMMAILGSIIIDQIIFKDDIELKKITSIEKRIKEALPPKTEELRNQISDLDTVIMKKEIEKLSLSMDINKNPTIKVYATTPTIRTNKKTTVDTVTGKPITVEVTIPGTITTSSDIPNPNIERIKSLEQDIISLRNLKSEKEKSLLNIRPELEKEINSKVGFLDELEIMYLLITGSTAALIVWLIWFFFLLGLEILVLVSKIGDKTSDYEKTVMHHMNLQIRRLDALAAEHKTNLMDR
jgi:hypothetical protein